MLLSHGIKKSDQTVSTIYDLGIATWACGDFPGATAHFLKAVEIAESLCSNAYSSVRTGVSPASVLLDSYKLLCKSCSALQCLMCGCGQDKEAIEVAERSRTFLHRLFSAAIDGDRHHSASIDEMADYAIKQRCGVVYFSISAGSLFRWFVSPKGVVKFVGSALLQSDAGESKIKQLLCDLRGTLGVSHDDGGEESVQLLDDVTQDDVRKSIYLQMLSVYQSFYYDSSHIVTSRGRLYPKGDEDSYSTSKSPFYILHDLLLSKLEKDLNPSSEERMSKLVLVVEGDLMLVPFPMLKKRAIDRYLGDNHVLNLVPSFHSLLYCSEQSSLCAYLRCATYADPFLTSRSNLDYSGDATNESAFIGNLLGVEPSLGVKAAKEKVLANLGSSEILHFACPMSWDSPTGVVLGSPDVELNAGRLVSPSSSASSNASGEEKENKENVLSMLNILDSDLASTKLVVLGAPYLLKASDHLVKNPKFAQRLSNYVHCLLQRSVKSVLLPLWPIPESASSLLLREFFKHLIEGSSSCSALAAAMATVRANQRFEHPSYWSGFILIGQDICLDKHDVSLVYALSELLSNKPTLLRDTIQLLFHLLEKRLHMEHSGNSDVPMFTSQVRQYLYNFLRLTFECLNFALDTTCEGIVKTY